MGLGRCSKEMTMRGTVLAALAACLLTCASSTASAATGWLTDPGSACAVFAAGNGDRVAWTGACEDGLATGLGTATFFQGDRETESFTADFNHGMVVDGHVITRWGAGWSYDGDTVHGRFNGGGILINDRQDRYLGLWTDGKMNGFGLLDRADGSRYAGEWKNDLPNGEGELRRADGSIASGLFADGKLVEDHASAARKDGGADPALKTAALTSEAKAVEPKRVGPFAAMSGSVLKGVDGSAIALNPIEGGIEMALTAPGGAPQKTTFTFMTDRLGTVVEDGGPDHGANVTGFFRLTDTGVELHYADGRAETVSATPEGGVAMVLTGARTSCRSWYPDGHVFSEAEKKAALADYAARLGLAAGAADAPGCNAAMPIPAKLSPEIVTPVPRPAIADRRPAARPRAIKAAFMPAKAAPMAPPNTVMPLTPVVVRDSQVHAVDDKVPAPAATATVQGGKQDAKANPSQCLKVDSDGLNWGFRNACDFAVQFAYCVPADKGLMACANGGAPGSVAGRGFGALMADRSLGEAGVDHSFRWIACAGGAGEVIAHLEKSDPPSGRCDRAPDSSSSALASAH